MHRCLVFLFSLAGCFSAIAIYAQNGPDYQPTTSLPSYWAGRWTLERIDYWSPNSATCDRSVDQPLGRYFIDISLDGHFVGNVFDALGFVAPASSGVFIRDVRNPDGGLMWHLRPEGTNGDGDIFIHQLSTYRIELVFPHRNNGVQRLILTAKAS